MLRVGTNVGTTSIPRRSLTGIPVPIPGAHEVPMAGKHPPIHFQQRWLATHPYVKKLYQPQHQRLEDRLGRGYYPWLQMARNRELQHGRMSTRPGNEDYVDLFAVYENKEVP